MAQALEGTHFREEVLFNPSLKSSLAKLNDTDQENAGEINLNTNCWQSVVEYLRGDVANLNAYYIPTGAITNLFTNPQFFRPLEKQSDLKYGDVVFIGSEIRGTFSTLHAAVYLGANLFFEKIGHDSSFIYRIVPLSDIEKSYSKETSTWQFLSYTGKPMPPISDFSIKLQDKDLAQKLPATLANLLTVEPAFSQGMMSFKFFGQKKINLERLNGRWRVSP